MPSSVNVMYVSKTAATIAAASSINISSVAFNTAMPVSTDFVSAFAPITASGQARFIKSKAAAALEKRKKIAAKPVLTKNVSVPGAGPAKASVDGDVGVKPAGKKVDEPVATVTKTAPPIVKKPTNFDPYKEKAIRARVAIALAERLAVELAEKKALKKKEKNRAEQPFFEGELSKKKAAKQRRKRREKASKAEEQEETNVQERDVAGTTTESADQPVQETIPTVPEQETEEDRIKRFAEKNKALAAREKTAFKFSASKATIDLATASESKHYQEFDAVQAVNSAKQMFAGLAASVPVLTPVTSITPVSPIQDASGAFAQFLKGKPSDDQGSAASNMIEFAEPVIEKPHTDSTTTSALESLKADIMKGLLALSMSLKASDKLLTPVSWKHMRATTINRASALPFFLQPAFRAPILAVLTQDVLLNMSEEMVDSLWIKDPNGTDAITTLKATDKLIAWEPLSTSIPAILFRGPVVTRSPYGAAVNVPVTLLLKLSHRLLNKNTKRPSHKALDMLLPWVSAVIPVLSVENATITTPLTEADSSVPVQGSTLKTYKMDGALDAGNAPTPFHSPLVHACNRASPDNVRAHHNSDIAYTSEFSSLHGTVGPMIATRSSYLTPDCPLHDNVFSEKVHLPTPVRSTSFGDRAIFIAMVLCLWATGFSIEYLVLAMTVIFLLARSNNADLLATEPASDKPFKIAATTLDAAPTVVKVTEDQIVCPEAIWDPRHPDNTFFNSEFSSLHGLFNQSSRSGSSRSASGSSHSSEMTPNTTPPTSPPTQAHIITPGDSRELFRTEFDLESMTWRVTLPRDIRGLVEDSVQTQAVTVPNIPEGVDNALPPTEAIELSPLPVVEAVKPIEPSPSTPAKGSNSYSQLYIGTISFADFVTTLSTLSGATNTRHTKAVIASTFLALSNEERVLCDQPMHITPTNINAVLSSKIWMHEIAIGNVKLGQFLGILEFNEEGVVGSEELLSAFKVAAMKDHEKTESLRAFLGCDE